MLVKAVCIERASESRDKDGNQRLYYPGECMIDPESAVANLTTLRGEWVFQFEGHTGKPGVNQYSRPNPIPLATNHKQRVPMSAADRKKRADAMAAGRERKRREREQLVASDVTAEAQSVA